jgi:hypothetical protein
MKFAHLFITLLLAGCASQEVLDLPDERVLERFQKDRSVLQKWTSAQPLPTTLADIGFDGRFERVYLSIWTDGGSVGSLYRDEHGVFFAFCSAYPKYYDGREVVTVDRQTYFIGVMHPSEEGAVKVPAGSPTERFLDSLSKKRTKKTANQSAQTTPGSCAPLRV